MLRDNASALPIHTVILLAAIGLAASGLLAACAKQDSGELPWARAALERNPQIKVLTVDAANNTIQVRVKATGETLTLTPGELAAIPIGDLMALTNTSANAPANAPVASTPPPPESTPVATATALAPATPEPVTEPAKPEYKVERQDGQVRVTGPGVSIESHKSTAQLSASAAGQRNDEPIICDGKRMLHLDGKRMNVAGDAIVARAGCELHITNSRIVASGTAITALDATVHITNSEIVGDEGSLTTSSAARVYLRNNKFTGLARRDSQASIQDQGGNTWR